jgi:hypothetical protein
MRIAFAPKQLLPHSDHVLVRSELGSAGADRQLELVLLAVSSVPLGRETCPSVPFSLAAGIVVFSYQCQKEEPQSPTPSPANGES